MCSLLGRGMNMLPGLASILYLLLRLGSRFYSVKLFLWDVTGSPNGLDSCSSCFVSSAIFSSAFANSRSDYMVVIGVDFRLSCYPLPGSPTEKGLTDNFPWRPPSLHSSFFTLNRGDSFRTTLILGFIFVFFAFT